MRGTFELCLYSKANNFCNTPALQACLDLENLDSPEQTTRVFRQVPPPDGGCNAFLAKHLAPSDMVLLVRLLQGGQLCCCKCTNHQLLTEWTAGLEHPQTCDTSGKTYQT